MSEIRLYGAESLQEIRSLRAMIENLIELLAQKRVAPFIDSLTCFIA
jgi:hypothetical protein